MALKRSSPLDDPPSASSSEGEEEEVESEEEITDPKSSMKNLTTKLPRLPSPDPLRQTSSSEEEKFDSDSGSHSDPLPPISKSSHPSQGVEPNIKSITSKPKNENPNHKRPTKNAPKRPIETDEAEKAPVRKKKKKKKVSDAEEEDEHLDEIENKSGEDSKKQIQMLWSDEDEIVILKGIVSYVDKGLNPTANMNEFLDFIKKSLRADVSRTQLISKIQRLKQKFHNNVKRAKKDDEFPIFSKAHELKSYYLSNKIWGEKNGKVEETERSNVGGDSVATDGKTNKNRSSNNGLASTEPESITLLEIPLEMKPEAEKEKIWNRYPYLKESLQLMENLITPPPGLGEDFMREGLGLIGALKVKELEQRWKILRIEELKTYLERVALHHEQAELILNELKS